MKQRICILIALTLTMVCSSFALEVSVSNLNIGFVDGNGRITTDEVLLRNDYVSVTMENNDLSIKQELDNLIVTHTNANTNFTLFKLNQEAPFVQDLKEVIVNNSNIKLKDKLTFWASQVGFTLKNDNITLETITLQCPKVAKDLAASCLERSNTTVDQMSLPESIMDSITKNLLTTVELEQYQQIKGGKPLKVKDFVIGFNKNHFDGSAAIKVIFDIKFTFAGDVQMNLKDKKVIISNLDIRKGIFPITDLVLAAIKSANITGITVEDKTIILSL